MPKPKPTPKPKPSQRPVNPNTRREAERKPLVNQNTRKMLEKIERSN